METTINVDSETLKIYNQAKLHFEANLKHDRINNDEFIKVLVEIYHKKNGGMRKN